MDSTFDLFDRLDDYWKTHSGDNIEAILKIATGRCEPIDVRVDLCAADLEWRLRTRSPSMRRAIDYQKLLGRDGEAPDVQRQLLEAEWVARSRFGDRPDVDDFARQIPGNETWRDELGRLLDLIAPLRLSIHDGHEVVMECQVPAQFVIGRANRHDPNAPAWNAKEKRVIVANSQFRSLSRMQLSVRRVRAEEIELVNLSRLIHSKLEHGSLKPGEKIRHSLPLTLLFTDFFLQICCESDIEFALETARQTD